MGRYVTFPACQVALRAAALVSNCILPSPGTLESDKGAVIRVPGQQAGSQPGGEWRRWQFDISCC